MKIARYAILLTSLLGTVCSSHGQIVFVAPTSSSPGSMQILDDITFTLTGTISFGFLFVLDEWVVSDGGSSSSSISGGPLYAANGGATTAPFGATLYDNKASTLGSVTPNDGLIDMVAPETLNAGDTLTLKAGNYGLGTAVGPSFNPQATQTFTGTMFLTDGNGILSSNPVSAPEPSAAALAALGALALGTRRRRRDPQ